MICEQCRTSGQRSTVRIVGTKQGRVPSDHFFDEQGVEHSHNPNVVSTIYKCSNGHSFEERSSWQCAACGWLALPATVTYIGAKASNDG